VSAVEVIADVIHEAEGRDWPDVAADPDGGCLGGDRCRFVAAAVVAAVRGMDADTLAELIGKDDSRVSFQPLGDGTYRVAGAIRRSAVTGRVIRDERTEP